MRNSNRPFIPANDYFDVMTYFLTHDVFLFNVLFNFFDVLYDVVTYFLMTFCVEFCLSLDYSIWMLILV